MPVETILTRELGLRFIDARAIVNEARVSLGLEGYPSREEEVALMEESMKIFQQMSEDVRIAMHALKADLDTVKMVGTDASDCGASTTGSESTAEDDESINRRKIKFWRRQKDS